MHHKTSQAIAFKLLLVANLLVLVPVGFIIFVALKNGWSALSWEFLTTAPRAGMREGGIFPAMIGTCYLVLGAMAFSVPLGGMAAVYLSEYSSENRLTRFIRLAVINLAGVPSVVYGLFGMGLFVIFFEFGTSILAGSLTLAIMNLPVVITATKEALDNVPQSFREASLALGASRWQTTWHVVLRHALPGILTGSILVVGRAAGEAAPILFTVAAFYLPYLPKTVFDPTMALPTHLYAISTQIPNISLAMRYGTALVLITLVLGVNFFATILRYKIRMRRKW